MKDDKFMFLYYKLYSQIHFFKIKPQNSRLKKTSFNKFILKLLKLINVKNAYYRKLRRRNVN